MLRQLAEQVEDIRNYLLRMETHDFHSENTHAWNMALREITDLRSKLWHLRQLLTQGE